MIDIFLLLVAFQIKHFISDYPLQTQYMLGKSKLNDWVFPLQQHCFVHSAFTFLICLLYSDDLTISAAMAFSDFFIHFVVDRVKASPKLLGRFKPDNKYFWWSLGGDQMAHHLTHYMIIYLLVTY